MATLKCGCGFQGNVPDNDIGKEFVCMHCGTKLVASKTDESPKIDRITFEDSKPRVSSHEQKEQEKEINIKFDGGVGPVGFGYQEIKEARKKIWKGAFLLVTFGVITLLSSGVSAGLAVVTSLPAIYGFGLLLWGSYEHYIHEHGIPKK